MPALTRILVPVDFSPCSQAALEYATFLAQPYGASIDVLHAWQPTVHTWEPLAGGLDDSLLGVEREAVAHELGNLLAGTDHERVHARIECGNTRQIILAVAERDHYDLIVMGTHGRTGLSRILSGSISELVVRRASCPVVTVHLPAVEART